MVGDPILKERFFGLTNSEGNHGEDVKEYYFYLDSTPTHSYMRMLYKYPQAASPTKNCSAANRERSRARHGIRADRHGRFNEDRYFDVFVEYAKADEEDILIRISVVNRGPGVFSPARAPHLWFRNTRSWDRVGEPVPDITQRDPINGAAVLSRHAFGISVRRHWYCENPRELLYTDDETNAEREFLARRTRLRK